MEMEKLEIENTILKAKEIKKEAVEKIRNASDFTNNLMKNVNDDASYRKLESYKSDLYNTSKKLNDLRFDHFLKEWKKTRYYDDLVNDDHKTLEFDETKNKSNARFKTKEKKDD